MRALITTAGDSSRLPGPPPKSFRLIAGVPVVGWILGALEQCDAITQLDVIVRLDQMPWAQRALVGNYECDLLPQATLGLTERIRRARKGDEALIVCLGDTIVEHHADEIRRLIANAGPRARVLTDTAPTSRLVVGEEGLVREGSTTFVDVGSYYIPEGFLLPVPGDSDESLLASLLASERPLDPVQLGRDLHWCDAGTPDGFAAAELALMGGHL